MHRTRLFLTAAAVLIPSVASAQAFDFETIGSGYYVAMVLTSGTQTLTITPEAFPGVLYAGYSGTPFLGAVSVIGSQVVPLAVGRFSPVRFSFLNPVSAITFAFGDIGGDDDTPARITAYDVANGLLGVFDTPYGPGVGTGATNSLTFGGAGASYFVLSSPAGVGNDDSVWWEVLASTAVTTVTPEPASLALISTGLVAVFGVARRRNAT